MSSLLRALLPYFICAIIGAAGAWWITANHYDAKIARKREAWEKDVRDVADAATLSCAAQLDNQSKACNESQKNIVANCGRTNAVLNRVRQITATCGVLQANPSKASGYDPETRRFWVDAEAVADLAIIAGNEANTYDSAVTLDKAWPNDR